MSLSIQAILIAGILALLKESEALVAPHRSLSSPPLSTRGVSIITALNSARVEVKDDKVNGLLTDVKEDPANDDNTSSFNWFKNWYPIIPVEFLDPEVPHRFDILGTPIVIWKDAAIEGGKFASKKERKRGAKRMGGEWRAFVDECPHRKVPLSEGRVEDDGTLLCSYHAFRFNGEGDLVNIPQLPESELEIIKKNPKSNCNAFPTKIIDGVLWMWPETGDDARIESALKPASHCKMPEDVDPDRVWTGPWNFRELPYSADYFLENVVDGNHAEVSHHNIVGNRYKVKHSYHAYETKLTAQGFSTRAHQEPNAKSGDPGSYTTFQAPCLVKLNFMPDGAGGASQVLELYATPTKPGFCMHVGRIVIIKDKTNKLPGLLRTFTLPMPKWLNHVLAASFLNQDSVFLHQQERYLAQTGQYISFKEAGPKDYIRNILPVETDRGVLNFRTWMRKLAGGYIPYKNAPQELPPASAEVCFDQYKSHTAHCKACQAALKNFRKARGAAFLVSAILAVWRPSKLLGVNMAATLLTAGLGLGLNKLIQLFYRYEFSHSHND